MSKITTATCKQAIAAAWPAVFGADLADLAGPKHWSRISKSGKKGEPIERLFFHDTLPVQALVVEENGAISRTIIRGFAAFDCPEENATAKETAMAARAYSNESFQLFEKYPLFRPCDFLFLVATEEEAADCGETWYQLFPTRDFGRGDIKEGFCDQVDYMVKRYLADDDSEMEECTFVSSLSPADCEADLLKRGFVKSADWQPTSRRSAGEGEDD